MRAVVVDEPGPPEVLEVREVSAPQIGDQEVLLDVAYCGCNWADTMVRAGTYPHPTARPAILGFEASGVIAKVGAEVSEFRPGDRVCAIASKAGGYAEQVAVNQLELMRVPDEMGLDVAAAFPLQALTAYHMLHTVYRLQPGDVVLCHAIGGGVGLYVTQFALHAGARVIGTVGTKGKESAALAFGAERVVNTREEDFVAAAAEFTRGRGIDVAIDSLGGLTLDRTYDVMRPLGHVISIGEAEALPYSNIRERILPKSLTFTRFHMGHVAALPELWNRGTQTVMTMVASGAIKVPIVERYPLDRAAEMHRRLEGRGVAGKLLLAVRP